MAKITRISKLNSIPRKTRTIKKQAIKNNDIRQMSNPAQLNLLKGTKTPQLKDMAKLLAAKQLYWMLKGSYKNYKKAKIEYAEFAVKHYDDIKTLTKNDMPRATIHPLSPLMPLYAIRTARILITDMFRKKTPAELKLKELFKPN